MENSGYDAAVTSLFAAGNFRITHFNRKTEPFPLFRINFIGTLCWLLTNESIMTCNTKIGFIWLLLAVTVLPAKLVGQTSPGNSFSMKTVAGEKLILPTEKAFTVLCFLGIECPLANLYAPRLARLSTEFEQVTFVGINSNRQDSEQEWQQFAKAMNLSFPIAKDLNNVVADRLEVKRNPEVIVLDASGKIRYRGRIDDQYSPGVARSAVQRHDLRIALEELLAGKPVSVPVTSPEGCLIGRVKKTAANATVTYAKHIAPIFEKHCVECHRAGEIGPFEMTDYDEIVGWGDMIVETIENNRMPPWHADPTIGKFTNARQLSDPEKQLIKTWVDEGSPLGIKSELPARTEFTEGWRLPSEPDMVISMRGQPFKIPASGTVDYQYFVVDPGFEEDKWVMAAEVKPGNRSVVHHSIVFIRPPDGVATTGLNWLEAYVPGQLPLRHAKNRARKIPAGSKLVFQQHYTPNGSPQSDITQVGLVFVEPEAVEFELFTLVALNQEFEIQPGQSDARVIARLPWLPHNGQLLSVSPHMHYRGHSFVTKASTSTGKSENLLRVPEYDFNWQHIYEFEEPLDLNEYRQVEVEITFDNSANNPFNPNPAQYVVWGDQTWEEMAIGFFNVARPIKRQQVKQPEPLAKRASDSKPKLISPENLARGTEFANKLISKNDGDGDGKLTYDELPLTSRSRLHKYDLDRDGFATFEEIQTYAQKRYQAKSERN